MQVGIDDHRDTPASTTARVADPPRVRRRAARDSRSAGCAWSGNAIKSKGRAALLPDNGAGAGLVVMQWPKPDTVRQTVCRIG
jgi:hypothetical protein